MTAVALVLSIGVSPARADTFDLACRYDHITYNACLVFQRVAGDYNILDADAGLDVYMSQGYAQEIVSHGAAVRASLWGDDDGRGRFLVDLLVRPGWPVAGPDGLSVELYENSVWRGHLDEDPRDDDEIYAMISYFDYHRGRTESFRTGIVRGDFSPATGGTPQCLVLC